MQGRFNSISFTGAQSKQIFTLSTETGSHAAFLTANRLVNTPFNNLLTVRVPTGAAPWAAGQLRLYYLYHQLAFNGQLFDISIPAVRRGESDTDQGSRSLVPPFPSIDAAAATSTAPLCRWGQCAPPMDPSRWQACQITVVEKYEVVVAILACKDLLPSQELIFQMSMGVVAA